MPISAILETGIFGEVVKMKYDVPNSKLEMLDDYYTRRSTQALAAVIVTREERVKYESEQLWDLSEINGPLVALDGVHGAGYEEMVELELQDGTTRTGSCRADGR